MVGITHQKMTVIYFYVTRSTSRAVLCGFLAFFRQDTEQKDFIKFQ